MSLSTQPFLRFGDFPLNEQEETGQGPLFSEHSWHFISFIFQKQFQDELSKRGEGGRLRILETLHFVKLYLNDISVGGIWESKQKQEENSLRVKYRQGHFKKKGRNMKSLVNSQISYRSGKEQIFI